MKNPISDFKSREEWDKFKQKRPGKGRFVHRSGFGRKARLILVKVFDINPEELMKGRTYVKPKQAPI